MRGETKANRHRNYVQLLQFHSKTRDRKQHPGGRWAGTHGGRGGGSGTEAGSSGAVPWVRGWHGCPLLSLTGGCDSPVRRHYLHHAWWEEKKSSRAALAQSCFFPHFRFTIWWQQLCGYPRSFLELTPAARGLPLLLVYRSTRCSLNPTAEAACISQRCPWLQERCPRTTSLCVPTKGPMRAGEEQPEGPHVLLNMPTSFPCWPQRVFCCCGGIPLLFRRETISKRGQNDSQSFAHPQKQFALRLKEDRNQQESYEDFLAWKLSREMKDVLGWKNSFGKSGEKGNVCFRHPQYSYRGDFKAAGAQRLNSSLSPWSVPWQAC